MKKVAEKPTKQIGQRKTEHYYTEKPSSKFEISEINVNVRGQNFKLSTASGIFSVKRLDKGTRLLIDNAIVEKGEKILDLGCGYGVVGVVLKRAYPSINVVFSDINERALKLTRRNLKRLNLKGEVVKSFSFDNINEKDFDTILLNPPQTAGKKLCFDMLEKSINHLKKGGTLQIVARHNKGGKTLSEKMKEVFGNVKDIAKKGGVRVYISKKSE